MRSPRAPRWLVVPLVAFVASRLVTLAVAYTARWFLPGWGVLTVLRSRWDAVWYLDIARNGYVSAVPEGTGSAAQVNLGFFPLFPLLTRAVATLPGISIELAAVLVNFTGGAVASVLAWRLVARVFDIDVADRTAFLFCFFPGTYALSLAYSEGIFLAFAIGCLLLLEQRRFWWAALVGGIGSAARPTGYSLALACAFAVAMHWRETRDWKPLASPVLAAGGFLAFLAFLQIRTGDALAYRSVQERGWGQGVDFGTTTIRRMVDYVRDPSDDMNLLVPCLAVLAGVALLWLLARTRPPGTLLVYSGATLLPGFLSTAVALTPRHLLVAFPLVFGLAWHVRENVYACVLALSAGGLSLLMFLTGVSIVLTP